MKKTAYIHIGMPKTGTTAIQETLQRFFWEGKLDRFNMLVLTKDIWDLTWDYQSTRDEKYFIEQLHKGILKFSKLGETNIIYSYEHIAAVCHNGYWGFKYDLLPLLAKALKDYDIKAIIYMRRQDLFIESQVNENTKTARNTLYRDTNYNYKELTDKCIEYFGPGSVVVRKYERENLYKNDSVTDFLHTIGLDELTDDYIKHKRETANSSLSPSAFRIAMADNKQYQINKVEVMQKIEVLENQYKNGHISRDELAALVDLYLRGHDVSRFSAESRNVRINLLKGNSNFSVGSSSYGILSPEERAEILAKYAEGNAAVAREYFGSEDGKLFNDKVPTNIVDINTEPSTTDIVQTFMPILIDLTQRCERLEMSPLKRFMLDRKEGVKKRLGNSYKLYAFARNVYKRFCK